MYNKHEMLVKPRHKCWCKRAISLALILLPNIAMSCEQLINKIEVATKANNSTAVANLYDSADETEDCSKVDLSFDGREKWQDFYQIGKNLSEDKSFDQAFGVLSEAVKTADDHLQTPRPPSHIKMMGLFVLLQQMALLSSKPDLSALVRPATRGFKPVSVALPITFEFGKASFTPLGQNLAEQLWQRLNDQGAPDISLVGHTDPIGSHQSNQVLSERRSQALKQFLLARNYQGSIHTEGKGETQPLSLSVQAQLSKEQLYQLYRRVELKR